MISRADQHDIDKLGRWHRDLNEPSGNSFPVYVVFLVSDADQTAHDIFRAFRSSFEHRDAGFGNLIIFGQHGVSSTVHALLSRLGLPPDSIPMLLLLTSSGGSSLNVLPLPAGMASGTNNERLPDPSLELLSRVEKFADRIADRVDEAFDHSEMTELTEMPVPASGLIPLVSQLVEELGQPSSPGDPAQESNLP